MLDKPTDNADRTCIHDRLRQLEALAGCIASSRRGFIEAKDSLAELRARVESDVARATIAEDAGIDRRASHTFADYSHASPR
jgi:hypothetical protein